MIFKEREMNFLTIFKEKEMNFYENATRDYKIYYLRSKFASKIDF